MRRFFLLVAIAALVSACSSSPSPAPTAPPVEAGSGVLAGLVYGDANGDGPLAA